MNGHGDVNTKKHQTYSKMKLNTQTTQLHQLCALRLWMFYDFRGAACNAPGMPGMPPSKMDKHIYRSVSPPAPHVSAQSRRIILSTTRM